MFTLSRYYIGGYKTRWWYNRFVQTLYLFIFLFVYLMFSDYAIEIFHDALKSGSYKCYLRDDKHLQMMWIDDCIQSIVDIMEASKDQLKQRTYNVAAMSFTPDELTKAIQKYKPKFNIPIENYN